MVGERPAEDEADAVVTGGASARGLRLFDMHCHLDFGEDPQALAADLVRLRIGCFSATMTPDSYGPAACVLAPYDHVRVGLGLHPWMVSDEFSGAALAEAFEWRVSESRFVAEVGLDFGPQHEASRDAQRATFTRVACACAREGGRVLSVHAVRAAGDVLDVLESAGVFAADAGNAVIFHWFSGTSDELQRAKRMGCFFSVNPRMLETKRGRAYAQAIPLDHLLLETDEPRLPGAPFDALSAEKGLKQLVSQLAALHCVSYEEVEHRVSCTSRMLLGF